MINFDGKEVAEEFNRVFKNLLIDHNESGTMESVTIEDLTLGQLWWLVKFAKHVRGRCRNNSAFNNYMNRNFSPAKFREVPKEYQGRHYNGLQIEVDGKTSDNDDSE